MFANSWYKTSQEYVSYEEKYNQNINYIFLVISIKVVFELEYIIKGLYRAGVNALLKEKIIIIITDKKVCLQILFGLEQREKTNLMVNSWAFVSLENQINILFACRSQINGGATGYYFSMKSCHVFFLTLPLLYSGPSYQYPEILCIWPSYPFTLSFVV